jgi:hypothetical protein
LIAAVPVLMSRGLLSFAGLRLLLMHRLLLFAVSLLVPLILLPVALILLLRRLPLLKGSLLLILLDHRVLLAIVLLLRLALPILVFSEPIRMIGRYPIRVLVVPPFAIVPFVLLIVIAVLGAPS